MAVAVDRIVVQVPPAEKAAYVRKAKRMGINLSELMRRGAATYSGDETQADLEALVARIAESTASADAALDDALAYVEASNKRIALLRGKP